jgi:hypothetical protein
VYATRREGREHAIRMGRTTQGSRNTFAKLDEEKVREIRLTGADRDLNEMPEQFGVTVDTIWRVMQGKGWMHVKP